jgi:hypothetical protein
MRVAIIFGFFASLRRTLADRFSSFVESKSVIFLLRDRDRFRPKLGDLKAHLFSRLDAGASAILVLVAVVAGEEWLLQNLENIIREAQEKHPLPDIKLEICGEASDIALLTRKIGDFAPSVAPVISVEFVRKKLKGCKVLCVRETQCAGFQDSLNRAGFPPEAWEEFFVEAVFESGGKASELREKASSYDHVLYAFHRFSHKFGDGLSRHKGNTHKGPLSREAVEKFKKWLLREEE